jgi:hypothetical protein
MGTPGAPLALFISYSHKDDEWRAFLDASPPTVAPS